VLWRAAKEVKAPVVVLIAYIETSFEPEFDTYANSPVGFAATGILANTELHGFFSCASAAFGRSGGT
jgi:hypothetical protein